MIGTTIGPYEIHAALGAGGMGEVYRARDSRLGRDVALKILPRTVADDPERVARFRREAQILATLNHPHIAAIHGLEDLDGVPVLVLELVEGPTLADRLAQGRVPVSEAVAIACQIASALEAAHQHGIIHRDLKPANIKLRTDGVVKVLDFGLAKALDVDAGSKEQDPAYGVTQSPTITSPAMPFDWRSGHPEHGRGVTRIGMIMGTASYMSPEQARGLAVDRGADVWAWGCVLFEMRAGRRAFDGTDTTEVIAAVVRAEPEWARLPPDTPATVRRLLRRCLEKDPRQRIADLRDARFVLEDLAGEMPSPANRSIRFERLGWIAALLVCLAGSAAAYIWATKDSARVQRETRVDLVAAPTTDAISFALSPDGEKLAFVASSDGRPMLWLRSLATGESAPLPKTDGARFPFWSPDSRSIGFFGDDRVSRIGIDGGSFRELASAPVGTGGSWGRDGVILFTIVPDGPIARVSETGQDFVPFLPGSGAYGRSNGNRFPQWLPDGRRYLYYVAEADARGVYMGTVDGPERRRLFDADAAAVFVPPAAIMFLRAGTLFLQRLDMETLALVGEPRMIARDVAVSSSGAIAASASSVGSIVYRTSTPQHRQLAWFERSGSQVGEAFPLDADSPMNPVISPDGRQVAVTRTVGGNTDIWLQDLTRPEVRSKLTTALTPDIYPVWSPDGRITYGSSERESFSIGTIAMDGRTAIVFDSPAQEIPLDWSSDGRFILFRRQVMGTDNIQSVDLWAFSPASGEQPFPVAQTASDERGGEIAPDGKWVAFESNESGRYEIYVQSFPTPGTKTLVSTGGGRQVRWAPGGRELFYVAPDARLMSVSLKPRADGQGIDAASPVALFRTRILGVPTGGTVIEYDVSRDGRFLMNNVIEHTTPMTLILNAAAGPR